MDFFIVMYDLILCPLPLDNPTANDSEFDIVFKLQLVLNKMPKKNEID